MISMNDSYKKNQLTLRLNKSAKRSIIFVLTFFVFYPFFSIFFALSDAFPEFEKISMISSYANYFGFIFAFYVALKNNFIFSTRLIVSGIFILLLLILNYFFSAHAQVSWMLNWIAFIFFAVVLSQLISRLSHAEMEIFQCIAMKFIFIIIKLFLVLVLCVWLTNLKDLIYYFSTERLNHIIAILTNNIGIQKQNLGTFYGFLILFSIVFWRQLTNLSRLFLCLSCLILFPSFLGINTLHLAVFLCIVWALITKSRTRKFFLCISIILLVPVSLMYWQEVITIFQDHYDRLPSLKFSLSTIGTNPFGLGNGGYAVYVEKYNKLLLHSFASGAGVGAELMNRRNEFWLAPESDLVYFFASWGILSIPFFSYFIFVLHKGGKLLHRKGVLLPIERLMLLMMAYMVFAGISQDNAGKLLWWIYMASGLGVLLRHNFGDNSRKMFFPYGTKAIDVSN